MATTRYQKQKTPWGLFAIIGVVACIAGYYISGLFTLPDVGLANLSECLSYILSHPFHNWSNPKTLACIGIAACAWFAFVGYYMSYYRNFMLSKEHGSEDWGDAKQITKEMRDKKDPQYDRVLSRNLRISLRGPLSNNNMLVIGSSGSYKTTSLMHPNLLQMNSSYVVLDVKGDTQRKLGRAFKAAGYNIRSLNLKNPETSDRYNPFTYIENEDDLVRMVKNLQDAVRPPQTMSTGDPFWDDGVRLYLQSLFYYEWLEARDEKRDGSMNNILKLVNWENQHVDEKTTKLQQKMEEKAKKYDESYPPVRDYKKLKEGAPDTVRSIVIMVNAMLSLCETAEIRRIFSGNDINIREIGAGVGGDPTKKTILFLVLPDNNQAYNFLISMFYGQMFDILIRLSDDELKAPLPIPVEVWMDEFYAGAKPAEPDVLLGVIRSRNITMIPMLQSIAQIKTLYQNDKWETFMDNVATVVFLGSGPAAESTHKFISEALGKATIDTRGDSLNRGRNGSSGLNYNRTGRELMTPAEVKRMPSTECIVFLESRPAVYDQKAIPFDVPKKGYQADPKMKERYAKALSMGAYEHPVHVVYDAKRLTYVTLETENVLSFPTKEEAKRLREAAKTDPHIRVYDIDEKDLLYLNFGKPRPSQEEVEKILYEAIKREGSELKYQENDLVVLRGMEGESWQEPPSGKGDWVRYTDLGDALANYKDSLSPVVWETVALAMEDGILDDKVCSLVYMSDDEVQEAYPKYKKEKEQADKEAQKKDGQKKKETGKQKKPPEEFVPESGTQNIEGP